VFVCVSEKKREGGRGGNEFQNCTIAILVVDEILPIRAIIFFWAIRTKETAEPKEKSVGRRKKM
jgi:hypothetical protein